MSANRRDRKKKLGVVYEVDAIALSQALQKRRGEQSQRDAAVVLGCSQSTLYHAERGLPPAKLDIYLRFCAWIGVTANHFVREAGA